MIDKTTIVNAVMAMAGLQEQYRQIVEKKFDAFVAYLWTAQMFKFTMGSSTQATTIGTRTYTLTGEDSDLDTIHNIRYGTYRIPIPQYSIEKFEQARAGTSDDIGEPSAYCVRSVTFSGGKVFPKIELLGDPQSEVYIYYDYWKKVPSNAVSKLPDSFEILLIHHMEYLYEKDPVRRQTAIMEAEKVLFDLYKRYADMSSQRLELMEDKMEDIAKIWHLRAGFGH